MMQDDDDDDDDNDDPMILINRAKNHTSKRTIVPWTVIFNIVNSKSVMGARKLLCSANKKHNKVHISTGKYHSLAFCQKNFKKKIEDIVANASSSLQGNSCQLCKLIRKVGKRIPTLSRFFEQGKRMCGRGGVTLCSVHRCCFYRATVWVQQVWAAALNGAQLATGD